MLKKAFTLGKMERRKGATLHRRLVFFFVFVSVLLILLFALLLWAFGITGKEEKMLRNFIDSELTGIHESVTDDFSQLAVDGIYLAENISDRCDEYFKNHHIDPAKLQKYPDHISNLITDLFPTVLQMANIRSCGGAFVLLDATVNPKHEDAEFSKAGVFIKKTQPIYTRAVESVVHCLRGPAQAARDNGVGLIAQWKMEFDIRGEDFFEEVMEIAKANPDLPLSRLYYWSGRITLEDNSESGFLLCVPLRSRDSKVFGVCGIEVSDRMFKSLYSPKSGIYDNVFSVAAPCDDSTLMTSQGIIAGNYYLTGKRLSDDLRYDNPSYDFDMFSFNGSAYGGKTCSLDLYPSDSPYSDESWLLAVLMPKQLLMEAITGDMPYFIYTVIGLLILSLIASVITSRRYLRPVNEAFLSIRNSSYGESKNSQFLEISDLIEFLESKDREYEETIQRLDQEKQGVQSSYDMAQTYISHLTDEQMPNVDRVSFDAFLECLNTLTSKEKEIFELYLAGKSAKAIMELLGISQNTLKYHNKNIYSKLGVNSRKQLLEYAALMKITM